MTWRNGSIAWAMVGIAALTGLLTIEAARAAKMRREVVERVLADDAALAAEGVAGRLQSLLAARFNSILNTAESRIPPTRDTLLAWMGPASRPLASQVRWLARLPKNGALFVRRYDTTAATAPGVEADVREAARTLPDYAYFGMFRTGADLVVFTPPRAGRDSTPLYALPVAAVAGAIRKFLAEDPVLPAPLTHGKALASGTSIAVSLPGLLLARHGDDSTGHFRAVHSLGDMFAGMTVEVGLADSLAPRLVAGGLPRSPLPFLLLIALLALGLATGGLLQLRQRDRLARLREDFVAGASHELRTPLAQIRLFAETLRLERVRSEEERTRAVGVVEREAKRLEHLVENLLHFSRAERGTLAITPELVDAGALTREIAAEFAPLAEKAGVTINAEGTGSATLRVDPGAWRQIVLNLLDNAVKYGGAGKRVTVGLADAGSARRLTVQDEGPGVSPPDRERIWERFWRGEVARSRGVTGTGIGLATVQDLVALHGGRAWVEDASPGARFVVEIPSP